MYHHLTCQRAVYQRAAEAVTITDCLTQIFTYVKFSIQPSACPDILFQPLEVVGAPGLEPGTSSLSEMRSNQLSYAPLTGCLL